MNEIRQHIKAVQQTRQITNAMYLLSTSRMKRMLHMASYAHDYHRRVRAAVKGLLSLSMGLSHQYLDERPVKRAAYLVISGDKGMCGAYNANVLRLAQEAISSAKTPPFIASIGNVGTEYFMRRGTKPDYVGAGIADSPTLDSARFVEEELLDAYDDGVVDEVYVISTRFINTMIQKAEIVRVLPLRLSDFDDVTVESDLNADILYHPSPQEVFSDMVPQYVVGMLYSMLVESVVSEHCARMNAMQSATNNADSMVKDLKTRFNLARQFAITQEIAEISGAAKWLRAR